MTTKARARSPAFLGIDAGGSHTEAVITDRDGAVLSRVRGGPGAVTLDNIARISKTIAGVAKDAAREAGIKLPAVALVVGAAGAGREQVRAGLERTLKALKVARRTRVTTDGEIALAGAFPSGPGIVLISGTGSIAYGRDATGTVRRAGGLGWQLGDEGGGYAMGRMALAAVGRALDGRGIRTALSEELLRTTGAADLDALVAWAQTADRAAVAALARPASAAAERGDPIARQLVNATAADLVALVVGLLRQFPSGAPGQLALAGSLLGDGSPVRVSLVSSINRAAPHLRIETNPPDPALGAARLATQA